MKRLLLAMLLMPSLLMAWGGPREPYPNGPHQYPTWDDFVFPALAVKIAGVRDPGLVKIGSLGGSEGCYSYGFDDETEEEVFISVQTPHAWDQQSMDFHVHWMPGDTASGGVVWGIEWTANGMGSVLSSTTTIATAVAVVVENTHQKHRITTLTTANMVPIPTDSSIIIGRLFRVAADPSDTYTGDAILLSVDCHMRRNKTGSVNRNGD